jgi:hypothetical protein
MTYNNVVAWMGQVNDDGWQILIPICLDIGLESSLMNPWDEGRRYFETPGPLYGGMVRGRNITTGDFLE